ncbi:hypothetical protein BJ322DRAFT_1192976 [Thelephora terrestris]|uniref:TPR-like protein n=1 Tax=Thelephora terrestris TaxID=56493 RepID=A0A9P6HFI3_9AGAM|nr:hypothetical protein BJ322DRAFT_1192976 [Thelephora terrestris]
MSTFSRGTSGPSGGAGLQNSLQTPRSAEQSIHDGIRGLKHIARELFEESSEIKEKFEALLKELGRLGLWVDCGDTPRGLQPMRSNAACRVLEKINETLQDLRVRIESMRNVETTEDTKDLLDCLDETREAAVDLQSIILEAGIPGELPPPAPRAFFGRDNLIEKIVRLGENFTPIALIGAGGIGKTSIALTVLHHDRIKERFGVNRRFIRCDQFPASHLHFLARLSKVIGAGVENPDGLAPLRPLLSTKKMIIVLDNADSILDPQGPNSQEIYAAVEELCQFETVCVCITSRITTVPRNCKRPRIPTLSMEAACEIFYGIYGDEERYNHIDILLRCLDFHPLSITLLATTASHNMWDPDRLTKEWYEHRAQVLRTDHNESLAATIELSLASPTFRNLDPITRGLLGVVAFFPQGVAEKNLDWLFPTIPDRKNIFDKFCVLSLAHRSNGFVTMLAPIRDYLSPQDPQSSPFLCAVKERYLTRLSVHLSPNEGEFVEAEWIKSEDVNVEHLLDVFTSVNTGASNVWDSCAKFMEHLYWHKPQQTALRSKIEGLPDDHRSKPRCLFELARLLGLVGNYVDAKAVLAHALTLEREWGDVSRVARALRTLASVHLMLGLRKEGIEQAEKALEMYKRLGDMVGQAESLHSLAQLLLYDDQLDAAEDAASQPIRFLPERGEEYSLCKSHRVLGEIYRSKGEKKKAIYHLETALGIASPFCWRTELFSIHYDLASLFHTRKDFDSANLHAQRAKSHTVDHVHHLGRAMEMQARIWCRQRRLEDARSEALAALGIYEKLGVAQDAGRCDNLLRRIERAMSMRSRSPSSEPDILREIFFGYATLLLRG